MALYARAGKKATRIYASHLLSAGTLTNSICERSQKMRLEFRLQAVVLMYYIRPHSPEGGTPITPSLFPQRRNATCWAQEALSVYPRRFPAFSEERPVRRRY